MVEKNHFQDKITEPAPQTDTRSLSKQALARLNPTYLNGQAGSIYLQHIPLVNASLPPGKWQTFDVVFNAPELNQDGIVNKKGNFTIFHNGVLIHNAIEISSATYDFEKDTPFTLLLQDHGRDEGNYISFRNIWMRKL